MTPNLSPALGIQFVSAGAAMLAIALAATDAPAQIGLFDRTTTILVPPLAPSYYPGAAWGDVDGDGWDDLYVTNYYGSNHLFLNRPAAVSSTLVPPRRLVDSTPAVLMDAAGHGEGAVLADFDNDGDLDLYVTNAGGAPNRLFANLGGGAWANVSAGSGVDYTGIAEGCATADFDGDGWLDLFLLNYGATSTGELDRWFKNVGGLSFVEVTAAALSLGPAPGGACAFADYDNDGDLDLFVGNDHAANRLFENRGVAGWVNVTSAVGGAALADAAGGCFGVRWIDYDNDGDFDLYLSNSTAFWGTSSTNRMFRNGLGPLGTRVLTLVTCGAEDTGSGMAVTSGDLNRDGTEDLVIANFGANQAYLGGASSTFAPPFALAPSAFFSDPIGDTSSSVTRCDFDQDGDLDVFFGGTTLAAFENVTSSSSGGISVASAIRTVSVHCLGDRTAPFEVPRDGHGTRARLFLRGNATVVTPTGELPRPLQQVDGGSGYAQDAPDLFWALPGTPGSYLADRLRITWANGLTENLTGLPSPTASALHKQLTIHYPAGIAAYPYGAVAITSIPLSRSSTTDEFTPAQVGATNFALAASTLTDGSLAVLAVGFTPISVPTPFGLLLVDPLLTLVAFATDGGAKWPLPLPADPTVAGATIYCQCFAWDSTGAVRSSGGLSAVIQP